MKSDYPAVLPELCVGCGACENMCPEGAIEINGNVAKINEIICRKCGNCIDACPVDAISYKNI